MIFLDYYSFQNYIFEIKCDSNTVLSLSKVQQRKDTNKNEITNLVYEDLDRFFNDQELKYNYSLNFSQNTQFQKKIYNYLINNSKETLSYKKLAENINNKNAYRAVGSSLNKNPF